MAAAQPPAPSPAAVTPTPASDEIAALQKRLKDDPAFFAGVARRKSPWRLVSLAVLLIALIFTARNVISVVRSLNLPSNKASGASFSSLFFETTDAKTGEFSALLWIYSWGALILAGLALVALVIDLTTASSRSRGDHEAFRQTGFVAEGRVLPVQVTRTNDEPATPVLIAAPGVDPTAFAQWSAHIEQSLTASPEALKAFSKQAFKLLASTTKFGDNEKVVSAQALDPTAPQGALLKISRSKALERGPLVAVWQTKNGTQLRGVHLGR